MKLAIDAALATCLIGMIVFFQGLEILQAFLEF